MATTIENVSRRRQIISLDHPAFWHKRFGYRRVVVRASDHNPRTGSRGMRETRKGCAGVITLLRGESVTGLPDAIAAVPDVRRLRAAGAVKLTVETAPPKAKPKPKAKAKSDADSHHKQAASKAGGE